MRGRKEALAAPLWDLPWNFPPDGANAFDPKKIQDSLNKSNSRKKRNSRTQTHHFIEVVFAVSAIFDVVHFQHLLLAQEPGHLRTENGENQQENGEKSFPRAKKKKIQDTPAGPGISLFSSGKSSGNARTDGIRIKSSKLWFSAGLSWVWGFEGRSGIIPTVGKGNPCKSGNLPVPADPSVVFLLWGHTRIINL